MPTPLMLPFVLPFLVAQGVQEDGPNDTFTVYMASQQSDGASFRVKAIATPIPDESSDFNGHGGGQVVGASSMYFQLTTSFENEPFAGSASQSSTFKFYLAGSYVGDPAALPTTVSYSIPKTETVSAHAQAAQPGNSASASTSNTAVGSQSGTVRRPSAAL